MRKLIYTVVFIVFVLLYFFTKIVSIILLVSAISVTAFAIWDIKKGRNN